jgi:hypothetical protein
LRIALSQNAIGRLSTEIMLGNQLPCRTPGEYQKTALSIADA